MLPNASSPISADPYDFTGYTAIQALAEIIQAFNNGGVAGSGIQKLITYTIGIIGGDIPDVLIKYELSVQINLFGGYPNLKDILPCAIFLALFGILAIMHFIIFSINYSRGHYFWISFVWGVMCLMRVVGFVLRIFWGKTIWKVAYGLTSEVFLIIPAVVLVSFDLILAQRLFTWRHPVGGSRKLFWTVMFTMYGFVLILIGLVITAAFVPFIYFLSRKAVHQWNTVILITSILIILYSLTSLVLIGLSYFFAPTAKDENLYTYQPWWIESFHPFYFVQPGAAQKAEETFMKRNHNHRHAIRVIAATHHHYNMVEGLTNQRGTLKHNVSMGLIFISALLITVGNIGRSVSTFQARYNRDAGVICDPVVMYICWGAFEVIINILYIVGRVDLRFYRPDVLPEKVRAIITAEQSYYPSDAEEEDALDDSENTDEYSSVSDKLSFSHGAPHSPPYPRDTFEKKVDDDVSDFHF